VKNITISLPGDVYGRVRSLAAERRTSVSALVRDYLASLVSRESSTEPRLVVPEIRERPVSEG
jgi:hypothetical protein